MDSIPIHSLQLQLADTREDGVKYVNLYSRGVLREYSESDTQLSSIDIQQPLDSSCQLKIFYSCAPMHKHYLVWSENVLIVVRKIKNQLKIQERLSDVTKVEVCDYFTLGYPQTVIWFKGDSQPRVTDFCSTHIKKNSVLSAPETSNSLNRALISQYQSIQTQIKATKKVLQEKRRLALVTMRDYMMNLQELDEMRAISQSSIGSLKDLVSIGEPWLRVHNNRYVIGFDVKSKHSEPIFGFQYLLLNQENLMTETKLFIENANFKYRDATPYSRVNSLEESKCCTVVAIIDEPCLTESTTKLSGILCFRLRDEEHPRQAYVQPVSVNFKDLISGRFQVKDLNIKEDILTILATSDCYNFKVTGERLNWEYILETKLSFSRLHSNYYTMKTSSLPYVLIDLADDKNIIINCKGTQELLIVLHLLKENLPENNKLQLTNGKGSLNSVVDSLSSEVKFLKDTLKEQLALPPLELSDHMRISIEPQQWKKIQREYSRLQAETDVKMFSLIPP